MRLSEDTKRAVVFLGTGDREGNYAPCGTAFFIHFDGSAYLVTVRHIAEKIGAGVFAVLMNETKGTAGHIIFDPREPSADYRWFLPDDPSVDLAIIPLNKDFRGSGYDLLLISDQMLSWEKTNVSAGIGDICQAVGLFSRFPGKTKHIPVVHTGNLASLAKGEKIRVRDRSSDHEGAEMESEGYLVELDNLPGLSGAPVFFRETLEIDISVLFGEGKKVAFGAPSTDAFLLGVWTGSWDGFEAGADRPGKPDLRVPVGMGFVTPVTKLIDLLLSDPVVRHREEWKKSLKPELLSDGLPEKDAD